MSNQCGAVVQLVRIPACHAGGRGFESRPLRHLFKNPVFGLGFVILKLKNVPFQGMSPGCPQPRPSATYSRPQQKCWGLFVFTILFWSATNESRSCASPIERKLSRFNTYLEIQPSC